MDAATYVYLFLIVLLSSVLQSATGFGFSILTVPLLLFSFDTRDAVEINNLLSLLLSLLTFYRIRGEIDYGLLKRLLTGSLAGMPAGLAVFLFLPVQWLKLAVGVFALLFSALLAMRLRFSPSRFKDGAAGGLSGFLSAAVGIPGPPLLAYFASVSMDKKTLRGTTLAFYMFVYAVCAALQLLTAPVSSRVWLSTGLSVPFLIAGIALGQRLFQLLNPALFRRICLVILLLTGIQLVYSGI